MFSFTKQLIHSTPKVESWVIQLFDSMDRTSVFVLVVNALCEVPVIRVNTRCSSLVSHDPNNAAKKTSQSRAAREETNQARIFSRVWRGIINLNFVKRERFPWQGRKAGFCWESLKQRRDNFCKRFVIQAMVDGTLKLLIWSPVVTTRNHGLRPGERSVGPVASRTNRLSSFVTNRFQ